HSDNCRPLQSPLQNFHLPRLFAKGIPMGKSGNGCEKRTWALASLRFDGTKVPNLFGQDYKPSVKTDGNISNFS
ncbi:MAG: hypothetical protein J5I57_01135, partial [Melioribacteraceae bacterium]|nr:hypothetical protein [Melioribacteraceae bacterium]